jgi:hypothetical protein
MMVSLINLNGASIGRSMETPSTGETAKSTPFKEISG